MIHDPESQNSLDFHVLPSSSNYLYRHIHEIMGNAGRRMRILSAHVSLLVPVFSILHARSSDHDVFAVLPSAMISNGALQMTPDAPRDKSKYDFL